MRIHVHFITVYKNEISCDFGRIGDIFFNTAYQPVITIIPIVGVSRGIRLNRKAVQLFVSTIPSIHFL